MVAIRGRGPLGTAHHSPVVNPGTLARTSSPLPGSFGLGFVPPVPMQIGGNKKKLGITVNASSEISGAEWKTKIDANHNVPLYFKQQIHWKNGHLTTPVNFRYPRNMLLKPWLGDWLSAFTQGHWEISTFHLLVTAAKVGSTGQRIVEKIDPQLSRGEDLVYPQEKEWRKLEDLELTFGVTIPKPKRRVDVGVTLNSGRGIILVATKVRLRVGEQVKEFNCTDDELVCTFFHEIGAHAGRFSRGLPSAHGDITVDSHARDIDTMFPKGETFRKISEELRKVFMD